MTTLPLENTRRAFPGLANGANQDWAFFDNAGGSHVLGSVIERITQYLQETPVQVGASYKGSQLAATRLAEATRAVATLLNATPQEIVFGPSASALLARLARALAPQLKPGDEIIITDADHEANITPWRRLAEQGVAIKIWPVNTNSWQLEPADLEPLLSSRTRLVCVTQASNILGQITDIPTVTRLAHAAGARVVVDGVAYAPHRHVDVRAMDADFYVFSGYKIFGPHVGVLYGKHSELLTLANLNHEYIADDAIPYKLQPGAFSYELAYGLGAVTDYLIELGRTSEGNNATAIKNAWQRISQHERTLAQPILDFLENHPKITIIGSPTMTASRLPIISFTVKERDPADLVTATDKAKLALRYGHFHAKRLTDRLELTDKNGVVRISLAHYNTVQEIERLIGCLDKAIN